MSTSIRQKITLFTLLPAVIFYSLISAVYIYFSFQAATAEITRRHLQQGLHYASVVDGHLREIMMGSQAMATDLLYQDVEGNRLFEETLYRLFNNTTQVVGVGIISGENEQFSLYWHKEGEGFVPSPSDLPVPHISQVLIRDVLRGGHNQAEWYTSSIPPGGDYSIFRSTLLIPVQQKSGNRIILRVDVDGASLKDPLLWYNPRTRLIMVNREGVVVYANGISMPRLRVLEYFVQRGPCEGFSKVNVTQQSSGQHISEFLLSPIRSRKGGDPCWVYREALERVTIQGQSINFRVQIRGEKKWVTATPIPSTGWYMSISILEEDLIGPIIQHAALSVGLILLALVLTIFCLWAVSGRITRPLNRLKLQMNEVAAPYATSVEGDCRDEAASLTRSFSQLVERLRDRERSLQQARANNIGHLVQQLRGGYFYFNLDCEGRIIHVSRSITSVLGYEESLFTGGLKGYLTASAMNQSFDQKLSALIEGQWEEAFEVEMRHYDGSARRIELFCTSSSELADEGEGIVIEGMGNDVTSRTRDTEKFKMLIASAPDATVITNQDSVICLVNRKVVELFGYNENELLNMPLSVLIEPDARNELTLLSPYEPHQRNQYCLDNCLTVGRQKEGQTFPMEVSSNVLDTFDGIQISIILRNITERKRIESELVSAKVRAEQASKTKSMFLSNISHELRTPLNGVLGYAQLLLSDKEVPDRYLENLRALEDCGLHLMTLINDILDITKIESGGVVLDPHPFDLRSTLNTVLANVRETARSKKLELVLKVDDSLPLEITGDNTKLRQILINLMGNAVKFTVTGSVTLEVMLKEQRIHFSVIDTGVGISEAEVQQLFKPFSQLKTGQKQGGTGLGLAISHRLVKAMGGELAVTSQLNKGSTFCFSIPYKGPQGEDTLCSAASQDIRVVPSSSSPEPVDGGRILVVDDSYNNRHMLVSALESEGYEVESCRDGDEAVEACRDNHYDLVLMDLKMIRMDGMTATKLIHQLPGRAGVKVIAVSASVSGETRSQIAQSGICDFVSKPVQFSELFSKMTYWLGQPVNIEQGDKQPDGELCGDKMQQMIEGIRECVEMGDIEALVELTSQWKTIEGFGHYPEQLARLCRSLDLAGIERFRQQLEKVQEDLSGQH